MRTGILRRFLFVALLTPLLYGQADFFNYLNLYEKTFDENERKNLIDAIFGAYCAHTQKTIGVLRFEEHYYDWFLSDKPVPFIELSPWMNGADKITVRALYRKYKTDGINDYYLVTVPLASMTKGGRDKLKPKMLLAKLPVRQSLPEDSTISFFGEYLGQATLKIRGRMETKVPVFNILYARSFKAFSTKGSFLMNSQRLRVIISKMREELLKTQ